jgi:hypothetical protein
MAYGACETVRGACDPPAPMTRTPTDDSARQSGDSLRPSARAIRYGVAAGIVIIGILCGAVIRGTTGGTICTAVVGIGLVGVVSLVFYDVGLTEDRDRDRMSRRLDSDEKPPPPSGGGPHATAPPHAPEERLRPRPSDRMRGQRRRLR